MKNFSTLGFVFLICCIIGLLGVISDFQNGWFLVKTEKTTFSGVSKYGHNFITIKDVYFNRCLSGGKKLDVWISPEDSNWINIIVDKKIKGTLISVDPGFNFIKPFISTEVNKVEVYVQSKEEKKAWLSWAKRVESQFIENHRPDNLPEPVRKITPS